MIRTFSELSVGQKRNIYQFINSFEYTGGFGSCEAMSAFYGGIAFDNGNSHFSLWEDDQPVGTLGVVAKEAAIRNEIFLTAIFLKESGKDRLTQLLSKAYQYCSGVSAGSCKLGLNHDRYYLMPVVKSCGFNEVYRYYEMNYNGSAVSLPQATEQCFRSLDPENVWDFQRVHNAAFLLAPNGAAIENSELPEYLEEYEGNSLAGIYYESGIAAGVYMLKLKDNEGYIDGIGTEPRFHGRGIGKKLLLWSIQVLQLAGAKKISLSVFDSNKKAFDMYLRQGFKVEREHSVWFEKKRSATQ